MAGSYKNKPNYYYNRLSLADLKAQKNNVVANLEAIKGGEDSNILGASTTMPADNTRVERPKPIPRA